MVSNLLSLEEDYQDGDAEAFNSKLEDHLAAVAKASPVDWNPTSIATEISYNHFSPFYISTVLYLVAFVITIFSWMFMREPMMRASFWMIGLALLIHVFGIAERVVISGRPPITNLYSSWVVVSAGCVVLLMLVEKMTKLSMGNLLASSAGFLSLQYAFSLSISQGDTFSVLRAVLDTQFWLTTHVIIINLGYSATLVAGLIGMSLLFCMLFVRNFSKSNRKLLTNIIYGTVCFALLFSFFGTVLGGLWADDSWGRFWGWDPKENGALMIVLWNAVILHARWGGMVKERGLAALAVFGNIIVLWSWEGVNQLGVGLHAYGGAANTGAKGIFQMPITDLLQEPMFLMQMFVILSLLITIFAMVLPQRLFETVAAETKTGKV